MKVRALSIVMFAGLMVPAAGWAGEVEMMAQMKALEARVAALEMKLDEQSCCIAESKKCIQEQMQVIEEYKKKVREEGLSASLVRPERNGINVGGFKIGAGMTGVGQYAVDTNSVDTGRGKDALDGTFSSDIGITKDIGDDGEAFLHMEYGQPGAPGVESEINVYPFTNVNKEADEAGFRISEGWYKQEFFDDKMSVMAGKFDPTVYFDDNVCANDETTQFLSRMFRNNPAIEFPDDNALGAKLAYSPFDMLELSAGALDANAKWERMDKNLFSIAQANVRPKFFDKEGNYRFILWRNDKHHTKLLDPSENGQANYGYAMSFDQALIDPVTAFARFGWQEPTVSVVEYSWSSGVQIAGSSWKRPDDTVGIAVGQAIPGWAYKQANSGFEALWQTNCEVYYNWKVNNYLALSPDAQIIWNPNGGDPNDARDPVTVYGVRAQVDF